MCLGARASSTQRANKVEALIKEGANESKVIVKLSNTGALQFKGNLYGDSIVIERRFRRSGPSTFKVRSGDNGRIISDRKDEIVAICDNYNIQVDNPLSVLTQETAKKFLVNSTPFDLYEFFMRATQLEQLSIDYAYSLDRMKSIQNSLNMAKKSWPALEETIEKLRLEMQSIAEQKEMAQKLEDLKAEILWANVLSREKDAKENDEILSNERLKVTENNEKIEILNQKISDADQTVKDVDNELTELFNSKKPINAQVLSYEKEISKTKDSLKNIRNVSVEINSYVKKAKEELRDVESKLEENLRDTDTDKIQKRNQVDCLEAEIQSKNREFKELAQQISIKSKETEDLEAQIEKARKIEKDEKRAVDEVNKELDKAKSAMEDRIKSFGDNLPEVMKKIQSKIRQFKYKPIGPIGLHVELTDMTWSKSMDAIIGSHLRSFITHDHDDRNLLESILKSCNCQNSIINLSPGPIDIRDGEPDPIYLTALRVLRIDNELVKKALIILSGIERILLISDRIEARKAMMARLRNVDSAYTHTHRVTATQNSLSFFAIYSNSKFNPFESVEQRIEQMSRQLKESSHRLYIASRDVNELNQAIIKNQDIQSDLKDQNRELTKQISILKSDIRSLEQSLKSTDETGIEVLNDEKMKILNNIDSFKSQFGEVINSGLKLNEELQHQEERYNFLRDSLENIDIEIDKKKDFLSDLTNGRRQYQSEIQLLKA